MKKFIYHIEHTNGMDQNVWTSAENQYEAEQEIRHDYHSIKSLTLIKIEDMYLENGDEVIEADNGRLILANSGAYCDEDGNPTGGCIDDEADDFIEALDVFKSHFKDYEVTEIRKFRDIIKPLTKTITVEL